MDNLSKEQKIGQLTVLFRCLDPGDLDNLYASFMKKFEKDSKGDPKADYVRKELEAIASEGDEEFAVHHMVISMAWTMFAADRQVHDISHFDEFTEELLRSHAIASLKKARLFLEISKKFVVTE